MQKSRETVSSTTNEERETCLTACCCRLKYNKIMNYHRSFSCREQSTSTGSLLKQAAAVESKGPMQHRDNATLILAPQVSGQKGEIRSLKTHPRSISSTCQHKTQTAISESVDVLKMLANLPLITCSMNEDRVYLHREGVQEDKDNTTSEDN